MFKEEFVFDLQRFVTINNKASNTLLSGTSNADSIYNSGRFNVTIEADAGDDTIDNSGSWEVTINAGDGNDSIYNYSGSSVTINAGAGDDRIENYGDYVTIDAGDGNDYIQNNRDNVTIAGGAGDDSILNSGSQVAFNYSAGDGNDLIQGFKATDTLSITGDTYSTQRSGSDILISVGDGVITLAGAASLDAVNIDGEFLNPFLITLTEGDDSYSNSVAGATIQALGGNDSITNHEGSQVSINGGAGNDSIYNSGESVSINAGAGNDSITNYEGSNVSISAGAGNDEISNEYASDVLIDSGAGDDYIYNFWGFRITVSGGAGSDSLQIIGGEAHSISGGAGDDSIVNTGNATIYTGDGTIYEPTDILTISGGTGSDTISNTGAKILFTYAAGDGNDLIQGFNATSTLQITGGTYSADFVGDDLIVTVDKGKITLEGAASLESVNINDEKIFSYSWTLDGTVATYGSASKTLLTVSGVKSLNGISLSGKVVTVSKAALNAADISVSDGYTLALASDVPAPTTAKATYSDGVYKTAGVSKAGYKLDGNSIRYVTADIKTIKFSGVADDVTASNFYVSGNTITVGKAAVKTDGTPVKLLTSGYTLKLGNGMAAPTTSKAWTLKNSAATYQQTTSAGYTLADNSITYSKKSSKTLVTVDGVDSLDGLKLSKKIVTVSAASLGTNDVSISDGYTLKLGSDVSKPSTSKAWSLDGTTAAYQQTTTAGYKLADNSIAYSKAATKNLITVSGVKSLDGLKLSKKIVTVSAASLGTNDVSISDGYKLKLGKDVDAPTSKQAAWTLKKTTATYKSSSTTAGYTLEDNVIRYSKKKSAATLATIKGVENVDGLSISGKMISAEATALSKKVTVSSDDYGFDFGTDYKKARVTGSEFDDKIKSAGQRVTILGGAGDDSLVGSGKYSSLSGGDGKDTIISGGNGSTLNGGAGNDLLTGSGEEDIFVYAAGDGNDTITNYDTSDKISLASGAAKISVSLGAVVFKVGSGKLTLKNAADLKVTYIDADGTEHTYPEEQNPVEFNAKGTGATLTPAYTDETFDINGYRDYKDSVVTINASAVLHPLDITGNNLANVITGTSEDDYIYGEDGGDKIFGGEGNDSLWGGAGNDTLTGDSGSDVFIFYDGDGSDRIRDYESGVDTVMIMSGTVSNPIVDGRDVIFSVGDGQITFEDAASKPIVLVNRNGKQVGSHTPK